MKFGNYSDQNVSTNRVEESVVVYSKIYLAITKFNGNL